MSKSREVLEQELWDNIGQLTDTAISALTALVAEMVPVDDNSQDNNEMGEAEPEVDPDFVTDEDAFAEIPAAPIGRRARDFNPEYETEEVAPAPRHQAPRQPAARTPAPRQVAARTPAPRQPAARTPAPRQVAARTPAPRQPAARHTAASEPADSWDADSVLAQLTKWRVNDPDGIMKGRSVHAQTQAGIEFIDSVYACRLPETKLDRIAEANNFQFVFGRGPQTDDLRCHRKAAQLIEAGLI